MSLLIVPAFLIFLNQILRMRYRSMDHYARNRTPAEKIIDCIFENVIAFIAVGIAVVVACRWLGETLLTFCIR